MTTGDKISKLRRENNYTQEQLAELLGYRGRQFQNGNHRLLTQRLTSSSGWASFLTARWTIF